MAKAKRIKKDVLYIGIDPGKSGGLAWILQGTVVAFCMPATERDIWDWFVPLSFGHSSNRCFPVYAIIEKVHSMPKQGVTSAFTFGMGYGGLRMALIALGIPFEAISPRTWQKGMGVTPRKGTESKSQWKNRLKARAQELFPKVEGITLATCDALLIAEYGRRKREGTI